MDIRGVGFALEGTLPGGGGLPFGQQKGGLGLPPIGSGQQGPTKAKPNGPGGGKGPQGPQGPQGQQGGAGGGKLGKMLMKLIKMLLEMVQGGAQGGQQGGKQGPCCPCASQGAPTEGSAGLAQRGIGRANPLLGG